MRKGVLLPYFGKICAKSTGTDCSMKKREEKKEKAFSSVWNPASKATRQGISNSH